MQLLDRRGDGIVFASPIIADELEEYADCIVASPGFGVEVETVRQIRETGATAIACYNDLLALNLWAVEGKLELRVGEDLSLLGVDGIEAEEYGLTSVEFSFSDVGRKAYDGLVARIRGKSAEECCNGVPVRLQPRQSVKNMVSSGSSAKRNSDL